jgi:hypothetical protein
MMTRYESLLSLSTPSQVLKMGMALKKLHAIALAITDNEVVKRLKKAKTTTLKNHW